MNLPRPILERRTVAGRHENTEFTVEAWLREGTEAFVHLIKVGGIPVPAGHLPVCTGMVAALEAGAHLARRFIESDNL